MWIEKEKLISKILNMGELIRKNNNKKVPKCFNIPKQYILLENDWSEKLNNVKNFRYKHKDWLKRTILSESVSI